MFPHMGDGGLALGAAVLAAVERRRAAFGSISIASTSARPTIAGRSKRACARPVSRPTASSDLPRPGRRSAGRRADRDVVPGARWNTGRARSGTAACWRGPIGSTLRDRLNLALKRRVWYQPFCPSMLESEAPRLLADWTGGRNRAMTMAYQVASELPVPAGRRHERRRHVPAADRAGRRRRRRSPSCCARPGGAGASAPC